MSGHPPEIFSRGLTRKTLYYLSMRARIFLLLLTAVLSAAEDRRLTDFRGEVLDMASAPIAGARIVLTNVDNGRVFNDQTDVSGHFNMIGLPPGVYKIEITRRDGRHIYSATRKLHLGELQKLNVMHLDLSMIATKASLVPFKGPQAADLQKQKWREYATNGDYGLSGDQVAELREENALILRYNELTPDLQAALKAQDWKQAETLLKQLVAIAPFKWELYQNLGMVQRNQGHFQDAVQSLEKGIETLNQDEEAGRDRARKNAMAVQMLMVQGESYAALDQQEPAAARFRQAAKIDSHPALAYLQLCGAEYNSGHTDEALAACEKAIAEDPLHPDFFQALAGIQMNLGRYEDAVRTYGKGLQVAETGVNLARLYHSNINSVSSAKISGAQAALVRMGQILLSQGYAYFQLRDYKHAAAAFERSARLHPYPSLSWFNLCATLYDMDDLGGAAAACENATHSDSKLADAYFVRASALYGEASRHGKPQVTRQIRQAMEKYLELSPDGSYATEARSLLNSN